MRLIASDFYTLHSPLECPLRVYLRHHGEEGEPPGAFEQVLFRLGERHERAHLETLGSFLDLSAGQEMDRAQRTRDAVNQRAAVKRVRWAIRSSTKPRAKYAVSSSAERLSDGSRAIDVEDSPIRVLTANQWRARPAYTDE